MRFAAYCTAAILLLFNATAAVWAADMSGRWKASDGKEYTFEQDADGDVTMRVIGSKTRASMIFKGKYNPSGFKVSARVTSVSQISDGFPLKVRNQTLDRHPDVRYHYDVEELDDGKAELTVYLHSITYNSSGFRRLTLDTSADKVTLSRITGLPNLHVVQFSAEADNSGDTPHWKIKASVENRGDVDVDDFLIQLFESEIVVSAEPGAPWRPVPRTAVRHPIGKGKTLDLEWQVDEKFTMSATAKVLQVVVDPREEVREILESDNQKILHRLTCADPEDPEPPIDMAVWVDIPEEEARGPEPDISRLMARMPSDSVDQQAAIVLCYIKLEAQRRARKAPGTVAGTKFLANLETHYLADYLADPSEETGNSAADALGRHQGWEDALAVGIYVPKLVRETHPGMPEWIYPATQFHSGGIFGTHGDSMDKIPVIDSDFLVGDNRGAVSGDDDVAGGGRNSTQVMHWATGVYYGDLPEGGMRELFIGYEYWHLEAWDIFGEDPINDLIAEEQGRMLGRRLRQGNIRSRRDLVRKMDADFMSARNWVGALLKARKDKLDALVLADEPVGSKHHWAGAAKLAAPWGKESVKQILASGKSVDQVANSRFIDHLIQIYTLIYETRDANLTPLTTDIIEDKYNPLFRRVSKGRNAVWELR